MKRTILFTIFSALLATRGMADSLLWDYTHGWTKGYVLTVSDEKGTITLHNRNDGTTKVAELSNAENILLYIGGLLKRIPEDGTGQAAIDGDLNKLELTTKDGVTKRMIYMVDPPGAIVLNPGYPAEKELEEAEEFRKSIDGYLARDVLLQLVRHYFPPENDKEAGGKSGSEQGGTDQPATAPKSKPEGSERPKLESEVRAQ